MTIQQIAPERQAMQPLQLQISVEFAFAQKSDLPKLEWYGEYTHFRRVFQRAYEDQEAGSRLMLLAKVNNWPIGQIFIQLNSFDYYSPEVSRRSYLYSLRVMDPFQGKGIGTALLAEAESILVHRGYQSVSIAAAKQNPGARRLYERLGFRVFSEDDGRWNYVDHEGKTRYVIEPCWILEKSLKSGNL